MTIFGRERGAGTALGRPRTYLNVVLDESGSMDWVRMPTVQAYNDFIRQQKKASEEAKDEVFVTLTVFSGPDRVKTVYALKPLHDVADLWEYRPDGGTALYDGIWRSIRSMEKAVGEHARVLTLVITDGEENESREITDIAQLKKIIESREARGNWTFIFLSAGKNPFAAAQGMGFKSGNVSTYHAQDVGTAMARTSAAVQSYRQGDHMQTGTFWQGEAQKHERPQWSQSTSDEEVEDVV